MARELARLQELEREHALLQELRFSAQRHDHYHRPAMRDFSDPPGSHDARLTAEERQRLRPTVDSLALERLLASAPELPRIVVIAHFATEVRLEDLLAFQHVRYEAGE